MTAASTSDLIDTAPSGAAPAPSGAEKRRLVFRHPLVIRTAHWLNVVCLFVLLLSGLQIFNAHPALYWGKVSTFDKPLLSIDATQADAPRGFVAIADHRLDTTGVLGVSDVEGQATARAFPTWATIPSEQNLAQGRQWHFLFAWVFVLNGLAYLIYGAVSGQLRRRYVPSRDQLKHFGASVWEHVTLRFPKGEEARRYNVLQKMTYFVVVLILLPLQIIAGLAMSPGMDAAVPLLLPLLGGRQSARTIHFVVANLLVLFVIVHVVLVLVSGVWNNMRGMITGWFAIERTGEPARKSIAPGEVL